MPPPTTPIRLRTLAGYRRLEHAFDAAFGSALNPLRHLGALGFLLFWWLAVSGIYLYSVLDTSVQGAYRSIDALSREPWFFGGWLRSLHRYAADAFVIVTLAHLAREWLFGRYAGFRRFSWWTGVPLLLFAYVCGVGGFWLHWDQLGAFSAAATAQWLDALPFFSSPLARNFLSAASVSDRLFSLLVFIHLGVSLLLIFGLWVHIQRISRAAVFPPRALALGTTLALLALALVFPVRGQGPADLSSMPAALALDWWLLFIHPLTDATSPTTVWVLLTLALLTLAALPLLPQPTAPAVAVVDPDNCNGCKRCVEDCPYAAITMRPHPNQRVGRQLAEVNADLCASCGICVGACPSSTPFRQGETLVTGIDMPQSPIDALRRRLREGLAALTGPRKIVVFGCDHGAAVRSLAGPEVASFSLICIGMLPPSFIEYALRGGAEGVLVTGCREGGCAFRLGPRWTDERLQGVREPHLRASVPREPLRVVWADAGDEVALHEALLRLRGTPPMEASA